MLWLIGELFCDYVKHHELTSRWIAMTSVEPLDPPECSTLIRCKGWWYLCGCYWGIFWLFKWCSFYVPLLVAVNSAFEFWELWFRVGCRVQFLPRWLQSHCAVSWQKVGWCRFAERSGLIKSMIERWYALTSWTDGFNLIVYGWNCKQLCHWNSGWLHHT